MERSPPQRVRVTLMTGHCALGSPLPAHAIRQMTARWYLSQGR
jgi:hypothetical protein